MIKTVVFDLGGVYFGSCIKGVTEKWNRKFGLSEEDVRTILRRTDEAKAMRVGGISLHDYWESVREKHGITASDEELSGDWFGSYEVNEGMPELLDELTEKGFEVLYLSNTVPGRDEYRERKFSFLKHFNGGLSSHKSGLKKPDPLFYEKIHELTQSRAGEIVFVDDKEKNLEPAINLGWQAIKFENPEKLKESLRERGVRL